MNITLCLLKLSKMFSATNTNAIPAILFKNNRRKKRKRKEKRDKKKNKQSTVQYLVLFTLVVQRV